MYVTYRLGRADESRVVKYSSLTASRTDERRNARRRVSASAPDARVAVLGWLTVLDSTDTRDFHCSLKAMNVQGNWLFGVSQFSLKFDCMVRLALCQEWCWLSSPQLGTVCSCMAALKSFHANNRVLSRIIPRQSSAFPMPSCEVEFQNSLRRRYTAFFKALEFQPLSPHRKQ